MRASQYARTISASRISTLQSCKQRAYLESIGQNGGYRSDAPALVRIRYALRKLSGIEALIGTTVHDLIAEVLERWVEVERSMKAETLVAEGERRIRAAFEISANWDREQFLRFPKLPRMRKEWRRVEAERTARSRGRRRSWGVMSEREREKAIVTEQHRLLRQLVIQSGRTKSEPPQLLSEHFYGKVDFGAVDLERAVLRVSDCLRTFHREFLLGRIVEIPTSEWLEVEKRFKRPEEIVVPDEFRAIAPDYSGEEQLYNHLLLDMGEFAALVYMVIDFSYYRASDGRYVVIDWKTGGRSDEKGEKHLKQTAGYAAYFIQQLGVVAARNGWAPVTAENIEIAIVYLGIDAKTPEERVSRYAFADNPKKRKRLEPDGFTVLPTVAIDDSVRWLRGNLEEFRSLCDEPDRDLARIENFPYTVPEGVKSEKQIESHRERVCSWCSMRGVCPGAPATMRERMPKQLRIILEPYLQEEAGK